MTAIVSGLLAGTVLAAAPAKAETLNLYTAQSSPKIAVIRGLERFVEGVKTESGGELELRLHLAKTLQIDTNDITGAVAANVVQLGDDLFFSGSVPLGAVLRLPFLIGGTENAAAAEDASFGLAAEKFKALGVTALCGYIAPPQYVWSKDIVDSLDDIKNKKIRVSSPEQAEFIKRAGGVPLTIPPAEITSSLQTGLVEGLLTAGIGGVLYGEALKSAYMLPVNYNNGFIIINTGVYEGMSEKHRTVIDTQAKATCSWIQETFFAEDQVAIDGYIAAKSFTITYPTDEELAQAKALIEDYWGEWAGKYGDDGAAMLKAVQDSVK